MILLSKNFLIGLFALGLLASAPSNTYGQDAPTNDKALEQAIRGDHRSAENKARDKYRNPAETLKFFGLKPDMTVVEIYPGRGWYTEILAPYLKDNGTLYVAEHPGDPNYEPVQKSLAAFDEKVQAAPNHYGAIKRTKMAAGADIAPEGSADLVLTFRNVHSWLGSSVEDQAFAAMFKALKPGGILGVVAHRGDPDVPQDPTARSGYVNETTVIELAEQAGFKLAEKSEINANPKDTKDYPNGVWTLPPSYRLGDKDREKYAAIGESDRMTLKFIKPAS